MSGTWAWRQVDILAHDEDNHGSTFCPIILGSDKIVVSVATGQNEYYPLYISNGLIHNSVHRAHSGGVTLCAFLAIPKTDREHYDSEEFRCFRRVLFHASLKEILKSLRPGMEKYSIMHFADGHYHWVILGLGPYIGDYPEQALLACIVQGWCPKCTARSKVLDGKRDWRMHELTVLLQQALSTKQLWDHYGIIDGIMPFIHDFPRADIHELLSPDILHQLVKGVFKDHLVTWVKDYVELKYGNQAGAVLAEID
ncbi:hypothetical protein AX14_005942 [Amanita brunnescens Koide BX004]|nr:hypothetical protein AX14_005942 [Amanita brunnescens Koide BX004]